MHPNMTKIKQKENKKNDRKRKEIKIKIKNRKEKKKKRIMNIDLAVLPSHDTFLLSFSCPSLYL